LCRKAIGGKHFGICISKPIQAIADTSYTVFAADVFATSVRAETPDKAHANSAQYYKDRGMLRERLKAIIAQLEKIAANKNNVTT
jgi:hypothetical protein